MNAVLAFLLFVGVGAIAVIHALWGLGSLWPEANEEALARGVVGDGRGACRRPGSASPSPPCWRWWRCGRGIVLGPVVGAGRADRHLRHRRRLRRPRLGGLQPALAGHFADEPFATRDKRYYSPYCLLLGVGYLALLAGEMER